MKGRPFSDDEDVNYRPKCACGRPVASRGGSRMNTRCGRCHKAHVAGLHGISPSQLEARSHPTRKYLKKKCDNRDGHLGFKCTFPVSYSRVAGKSVLEVDHVDGNPRNNDPSNLQTYCPNCHKVKTYLKNDHMTPGRKS
jgi:hypothetical protein